MRPERAFDLQAIDDFRPVQPLGDLRTIIGQRGRVMSLLWRAFFVFAECPRWPFPKCWP